MPRTSWWNKILDGAQEKNKIYVGDMNNLSYQEENIQMTEKQEELKVPLDEGIICFKYRHLKWDSPT